MNLRRENGLEGRCILRLLQQPNEQDIYKAHTIDNFFWNLYISNFFYDYTPYDHLKELALLSKTSWLAKQKSDK